MPYLHLLPEPPAPFPRRREGRTALPLAGLTILAVEDSHFAAEALRLLCHRSGARLRRADNLETGRAHLTRYAPDAVVVDLGLPDGAGEVLIAEIAANAGGPVILAASGDSSRREPALAAGAHAFLEKPLDSLALFQQTLLDHLPGRRHSAQDELLPPPDPFALREDLTRAADLAATVTPFTARARYLAGFVSGIARSAGDKALEQAAQEAADSPDALDMLKRMISARLAASAGAF
ncbi:response regulator [Rhodobacter sp. CZR27]|uniref:response regulator n=1 Tax=Rhodobacter sp. CZR27 TaxID=2033869 RepID=UPI000BBF0AB1|nr:response regulator [Rhodobacter sp. CZR27]